MITQDISSGKFKKALIIGGGLSGFSAALLLRQKGLDVVISDQKSINPAYKTKLTAEGIKIFEDGHHPDHIDQCGLIITSPGVSPSNILLELAISRNITILSEIDLALLAFEGYTIGITGTNGKSTICSMVEHGLIKLGFNAKAGGNFGDPPSLMIAEKRAPSIMILELSSYQLESSKHILLNAASFTNFSSDHLARHGSLENYFKIKWRIFDRLVHDGLGILSQEVLSAARTLGLSLPKRHCVIDDINLNFEDNQITRFPHNISNLKTANLFIDSIVQHCRIKSPFVLNDYRGLPFRCQKIAEFEGVAIFNDSKSTNVESTLAALSGFNEKVILMMGGQGKGESFSPIVTYKHIIGHLITFGASG